MDNIKVGKVVTFKVDALPKQTFQGVVSQIRMNPTTVQSVVTYDTIIEFANPELKLFPGMTAYVFVRHQDNGQAFVVQVLEDLGFFRPERRARAWQIVRCRKDDPILSRPRASEVLKTLPTLED